MLRSASLFQFQHGDHICLFYRNEEQLREVLIPYLADGLRKGERCFCAQPANFRQRILDDLNFLGIDTDAAVKKGALEIHTEDEAYFRNNRFSPTTIMDMLLTSLDDSMAKGFTGFRTAGELSWASQGGTDCDQLIAYEQVIDRTFPGRPATGLCQYNMNLFAPEIIKSIIDAHRLNLSPTKQGCFHNGLSCRHGNYSTEIVADKFVLDPKYYYVVQQNRPREIVGWGIAPTFEGASQQAEAMFEPSAN